MSRKYLRAVVEIPNARYVLQCDCRLLFLSVAPSDELGVRKGQDMNSEAQLKAIISKYLICWSAYPEKAFVEGAIRQIGFRLELYGTYPPGVQHADPGYVRCHEVWAALKAVAQSIVPKEIRESECEVEVFDNAVHYSHIRRNRRDVELHIRITHRSRLGPVDEFENYCLKQMTANLEQLGVPEDYWKDGDSRLPTKDILRILTSLTR
jgi:hypothetical protein